MHTPKRKNPPLGLLIAGVVAILSSSFAVGSLAFPASQRDTFSASAETARAAAVRDVRSSRLCTGCGVIQSIRKIAPRDAQAANGPDLTSQRGEEITVLLQDGSTRVIIDANPAQWKYGERLSIIAGIDE